MIKRALLTTTLAIIGAASSMANTFAIDGTISAGEWAGAATYTIGNGAGTAYLSADTNFIYGAFDITGWTAGMGAGSQGDLLGFGVWKANDSYGPTGTGVEFQQSTTAAAWGNDGNSGTMNGLESAFRIDTVLQGAIPGSLEAMDSFATGHRVWEVMIPVSSLGVNAGDTLWVVGGINYNGGVHWYPDTFPANYTGYAPVVVDAAATPEPSYFGVLALGLGGFVMVVRRRKRA